MEIYKCEGPGCNYVCHNKHQINHHHIVPKADGGSDKKINLVRLCPNCHNRIYVPTTKRGIHSIKSTNWIILKQILTSSAGHLLEYETQTTTSFTYCDTWRNTNIDRIISDEFKK